MSDCLAWCGGRNRMRESVTLDSTVVASPSQVSSKVRDGAVILGLKTGKYYGLDAIGQVIWQMLQSPQQVAALCDVLLRRYDVSRERCETELMALLNDLRAHDLIEVVDADRQ